MSRERDLVVSCSFEIYSANLIWEEYSFLEDEEKRSRTGYGKQLFRYPQIILAIWHTLDPSQSGRVIIFLPFFDRIVERYLNKFEKNPMLSQKNDMLWKQMSSRGVVIWIARSNE